MCGRYTLHQKAQDIAKRYNLAKNPHDIHDNFNVAPGQFMPVVYADDSGKTSLEIMKWGLVPFWAKDPKIGYKLINARADSIFEKPTWRKVILKKRCLIPADGFYEWKRPKSPKEHKTPFYIHPKQSGVFSFAGVWETWKDSEDKEWKTYSIITTEPNKEMSKIHDRMPVILSQKDEADWLEPLNDSKKDIEPFLHPFKDNGLEIYEVSEDVNSPRNNNKHLIYKLSD